jgi:hypothetical protein
MPVDRNCGLWWAGTHRSPGPLSCPYPSPLAERAFPEIVWAGTLVILTLTRTLQVSAWRFLTPLSALGFQVSSNYIQ